MIGKLTSQMTKIELAKTFAAAHHHHERPGGWIYNADGTVLAHGWYAYAQKFSRFLIVGKGIDWTASTGTRSQRLAMGRRPSSDDAERPQPDGNAGAV